MMQSSPLALAASLAMVLAACNPLHTARRAEEVKPDADRAVERFVGAGGSVAAPSRWWTVFDDPGLTAAIDRLLADNLDLAQAWSRFDQTRAIAAQQGSARYPSVNVSASGGASQIWQPTTTVGPMGPVVGAPEATTVENYSLSVGAAYEIDLWDRLGAQSRAAELDVVASRLDLETLAITLSAQAAELWFTLAEMRATEALLEQQIATNETLLELARFRFGEGLSSATAVLQQEQLLLSTRRQVPGIQARRATLEHQLAVLLGRPPAEGTTLGGDGSALPDPPALPAIGLPADLLANRPDIRAAQSRVAAADERIGAAIAGRMPSLTLSASIGFSATSLTDLVEQWVWSIAGSLLAPVFDGGRRSAEVERTRAAVRGALAAFTQSVIRAVADVEDALVLEARQGETLERLEAELAVSRQLLDQARARYTEGLTDYLPVLNALQGLQRTELSVLSARRQRLSYRIQLYRALGGRWTAELAPVARREAAPAPGETR